MASTDVLQLLGWRNFVDFVPVIDGDVIPNYPKALLGDIEYLRRNGITDRKYVSGMVNNEGGPLVEYFFTSSPNLKTNDNFRKLAGDYAEIYQRFGVKEKVKDFLEFIYTYPREPAKDAPNIQSFADLTTDSWYVYPSVAFLSMLAQASPDTDTYQYLFDHTPELVNRSFPAPVGTGHSEDLNFLFDQAPIPVYHPFDLSTPTFRSVSRQYRGALAAFAVTGRPGQWPRFDLQGRAYQAVGAAPAPRSRVFAQRMSFWQDFLPNVLESTKLSWFG